MEPSDLRAYRKFVAPTKKGPKIKVDGKWERQEPTESIASHKLIWRGSDDLLLRAVMERGSRQRSFPMRRFPFTQKEFTELAKWIANLLYGKKDWRDFVETIEDAIGEIEEGKTVIIPVNDAAYIEDQEQDMS